MNLKIEGFTNDVSVITTDSYATGTHIFSSDLYKLRGVLSSGQEGEMLVWKDGGPQWVKMPTSFQTYFNQINK